MGVGLHFWEGEGKGHMREKFTSLKLHLSIAFFDFVALGYLWAVGTRFLGVIFWGKEAFSLLAWPFFVIFTIEGTALWESLGFSLGMKLAGRRLLTKNGVLPKFPQRLAYLIGWHFSWPLLPLLLFLPKMPQETISGLTLTEGKVGEQPKKWYKTSWGAISLLIVIFSFGAAWDIAKVDPVALVKGAPSMVPVWREMVNPDIAILESGLKLTIQTLFMAILATVFGVALATPLSFFAARNLMQGPIKRPIYTLIRGIASFMRSIDAVIWALVFCVGVGVGPFAGMLALWVFSIANLLKLYSEQLESVNLGPIEAIRATGANKLEVIRYGIIPQIFNPFLSFTLYQWDINVRLSPIVGLVGGGGLGFKFYAYMHDMNYRGAGTLTILIIAMVWAIDYTSSRLRAKLS